MSDKSFSLLSHKTISAKLSRLSGWHHDNGNLKMSQGFTSFKQSIQFVYDLAVLAENLHHHPDINIRYNWVELRLTTKDKNGVTEKDFELAQEINTLLKNNYYGMVHEK